MSKDAIINIRISKDVKESAQKVVKELGYKNLSCFIREFINEIVDLDKKNISELELLEEILNTRLNDPGLSMMKKFSIRSNLNVINQFKEILNECDK